ncbi:cupin domain-containing protein [Streptomyces parvulus]|uniref:cupin domain-containing protein n=1 Tax=Streptomyces parvulus TaxID=146923 RepID=UPI003823E25D
MYPSWIEKLPEVDVNFPGAIGNMIGGPDGQVVFWSFSDGGSVPPHRHGPQIGVVLEGRVDLTVEGTTRSWTAGQMFTIGNQEEHSAELAPGTRVIEVFEEADRHRARP